MEQLLCEDRQNNPGPPCWKDMEYSHSLQARVERKKKEKVHQYSTTAHQILPIGVIEDI